MLDPNASTYWPLLGRLTDHIKRWPNQHEFRNILHTYESLLTKQDETTLALVLVTQNGKMWRHVPHRICTDDFIIRALFDGCHISITLKVGEKIINPEIAMVAVGLNVGAYEYIEKSVLVTLPKLFVKYASEFRAIHLLTIFSRDKTNVLSQKLNAHGPFFAVQFINLIGKFLGATNDIFNVNSGGDITKNPVYCKYSGSFYENARANMNFIKGRIIPLIKEPLM